MVPVRGLAVAATSRDAVRTLAIGYGAPGNLVAQFSAGAIVSANHTLAHIGNGAVVNESTSGATDQQTVLVTAGSDLYFAGLAGGAAMSSPSVVSGSAGGAFNLALTNDTTEAGIGGATVNSKGDVLVTAKADQDIMVFAAGLVSAVGGSHVLADGSVDFISIKQTTHAFIGDGAKVNADGNVLVSSDSDTDIDTMAGAAALGRSIAGAGFSFATVVIGKDTEAFIGKDTIVNAKGNSPGTLQVFDGTIVPSLGQTSIHGVAVQALATEDVFNVAGAGTASSLIGLSGSVTAALVDSDTSAFIDENAQINTDESGANSAQTVNVSAANQTTLWGLPVNFAFGFLSTGVGVDIGVVRNDTTGASTKEPRSMRCKISTSTH